MAEDGLRFLLFDQRSIQFCLVPPREDVSSPIVPLNRIIPEPIRGARGPERGGPTRSHPEPGRDPPQRRRVLWGCPTVGEAAASPPDRLQNMGLRLQ
jgi:hypothetical protein